MKALGPAFLCRLFYIYQMVNPSPSFTIKIIHQYRTYNCRVQQILLTDRIEQFKIGSARKYMIIETNRPLFRNKGIMKRQPDVKIIYGEYNFGTTYDKIVKDILAVVDSV